MSGHPNPHRESEPQDVDALLASSLSAQTEEDFAWKEPERRPRWWERAAQREAAEHTHTGHSAISPRSRKRSGLRVGSAVLALVTLLLALWVIASVALGITVDPVVMALVVCVLAGTALVASGLRPKPGTRI